MTLILPYICRETIIGPVDQCKRYACLEILSYQDSSVVLVGIDQETRSQLWEASCRLPDHPLPEGHLWVKGPYIESLLEVGVIRMLLKGKFIRHPTDEKITLYQCELI